MMPDRVDLSPILDVTPLDDALEAIFEEWKVPRSGGASGRGWSSRSVFMLCPYKFERRYKKQKRGGRSVALEVGGLFHQLIALKYLIAAGLLQGELFADLDKLLDTLRTSLLTMGCSGEVVMEAYRLYHAYTNRFDNDYLRPIAVEELGIDKEGNTCRYDLVAEVLENGVAIPRGTWIVEHKTAARFDNATLDSWKSDGEILGQMMVWQRTRLDRKYGLLQGVIVNLISKTKVPAFERIVIPVQRRQLRQHSRDLKIYDAMERLCEAMGTWPRSRAACVGRYGKCEFFDHCADGTED